MKRFGILMVVLLVSALGTQGPATGAMRDCADEPRPATHELEAHAYVKGNRIEFKRDPHNDVELCAGDRLKWILKCEECPSGIRLEIDRLRNLAILGLLDEEEETRARDNARANRPVEPNYKGKPIYNPGAPFLGRHSRQSLTEIESLPYREFQHEHLWKFDWVIMLGDTEKARWDPHFSGAKSK